MSRIISNFSCGAASAVATKLVLSGDIKDREIVVVNAFMADEHNDNRRFLADCAVWFGRSVTVVADEKYGASAREVWRKTRFIKGHRGASCSRILKRELLDSFLRPNDVVVLGYTMEEQDRLDRWIDANNGQKAIAPLIEKGLSKADCLAIVERAGIQLPIMYRLGYSNANCIGCCKGQGYWNKIRVDFPMVFEEVAQIEQDIGPGSFMFRDRKSGKRYSLRDLDPNSGRHDEILPDCGVYCELAEQDINEPAQS